MISLQEKMEHQLLEPSRRVVCGLVHVSFCLQVMPGNATNSMLTRRGHSTAMTASVAGKGCRKPDVLLMTLAIQ